MPRSSVATPILLGLVSALFFSTTFVVNRAIGLAGGHWVHPTLPTTQQMIGTFVVALCGTVIGTSIFLMARQSAGRDANAIAKVDATQAGYTAFSLAGEVLLLGGALPGALGLAGLVLVLGGLAVYTTTGR